ncbi:MAG: hypothetical protein LUF80_00655 [Oscillospiraceae bacterium]|nr:hypothetical protein [Oscillospiraceae bacterium]
MKLPTLASAGSIQRQGQTSFGGINHVPGCGDGAIWDMENLCSDYYPVLAPRPARYIVDTLETPNGIYAHDGLFTVDGTALKLNSETIGTVEDSEKVFCSLGSYVCLWPDKLVYNLNTGDLSPIEVSWSGTASIQDGTYADQEAMANTIYAEGVDWSEYFSEGDAVEISGSETEANNVTIIIREIDGEYLRFYEYSFTLDTDEDGASVAEEATLTISRNAPDFDFLLENDNRLWGCKGDTLWACKLGDPFNWYVFDGLSTDSYSVDVGSEGDFTGCCRYLGYPCFFKENGVYKVYGSLPTNFEVLGSATLGTIEGAWKSFAVANEKLYYLSRAGIMVYAGGTPAPISSVLGAGNIQTAIGGSDGLKYYCSLQDGSGDWHLYVYDTTQGLWHREDDFHAVGMAWYKGLYALEEDGTLALLGSPPEVPEGAEEEDAVSSMVEFGDFAWGTLNKKSATRIMLRLEMDEGVTVSVQVSYDSSGTWEDVCEVTVDHKCSRYLPALIRRCDHYRLRLNADGPWKLYALGQEFYSSSAATIRH